MAWLAGYNNRIQLTYSGSAFIGSDQTNFTLICHMDATDVDFWNNNPPVVGGGVRITTSDGTTLCNFQVESYDTIANDGWWHIKVPILSASADTILYIYFDAIIETDGSNKEGARDANHVAAYLLNKDQVEGFLDDATANNLDLTNSGTTSISTGVDLGRYTDGVTPTYLVAPASASLLLTTNVTVEALAKQDTGLGGGNHFVVSMPTNAGGWISPWVAYTISFIAQTTARFYVQVNGGVYFIDGTVTAGTENHITGTYDGTMLRLYINGVVVNTLYQPGSIQYTGTPRLTIGAEDSIAKGATYQGTVDEVIVSNVARSADWIAARHQSIKGTWLTKGVIQSRKQLTGSFAAQSSSSGDIIVAKRLTGSFTAQSGSSGDATIKRGLTGSFAAQSGSSGSLTVVTPGTINLVGSFAAQSGSSGSLGLIQQLIGSFAAQSGSSGSLAVTTTNVLFGVSNFPQGVLAEYQITDSTGTVITAWTNTNVIEIAGPSKSGYTILTNAVTYGDKGTIYWRTPDLSKEAFEPFDLSTFVTNVSNDHHVTVSEIEASTILAKEATLNTRLATSDYTPPDNASMTAIKAKTDNLPDGVIKNQALNNFTFQMLDSTNATLGKTGLTVTAERSIDGGAFASCTNSVVEIGGGVYRINLSASDLNGDTITLKFTATGAVDRIITILTQT